MALWDEPNSFLKIDSNPYETELQNKCRSVNF